MNVTEIDNVFHCDCGYSWQRGKSGAHDCTVGLRAQRDQLAAENSALKNVFGSGDAVMNFLTIALRHTTYDEIDLADVTLAFQMSLPQTPSTDAWQREQMAKGVEMFAEVCSTANNGHEIHPDIEEIKAFAAQLRAGEAV